MQEKLQNDFVEELKNDVFKNFARTKKTAKRRAFVNQQVLNQY